VGQRLGPLLVIAILFVALGASGGTTTDPELRGEFLRMKNADQAVRDLPLTTEGEKGCSMLLMRCTPLGRRRSLRSMGPAVAQVGKDGAFALSLATSLNNSP